MKLAFGSGPDNSKESNNEARMTKYNATKNDLDMFKPRRAAVAKSFDFTVSDSSGLPRTGRNMYNSSIGSGTLGGRSDISKMSQTLHSTVVGSRFAMGGNSETLRVGHQGLSRPPQMMCYKPRMHESDLVSNLERYVSKNSALADGLTFNRTTLDTQKWASQRDSPSDCIGGP